MGGIGSCCCGECDMTLASLPTVTITGMSVSNDWHWIADCCAEINLTFDDVQTLVKHDGGDVMSYDKTEICETERFTYDRTCGDVTQEFWTDDNPGSGRGYIAVGAVEPAYDCCDPLTLTQIHTTTKTVRSRGGQRFIVAMRPIGISVVIKKVTDYVCTPAAAVTRYIMRSTYEYEGYYEYCNYGQVTEVYTSTADPACFEWPADTSTGTYPFDIDECTGELGVATNVSFCREKVLTAIPSVETSYTFAIGDVPNAGCVFTECFDCPPDDEVCFTSGPTGDEEPSTGFCEATIITEETDAAYTLQLCLPHKIYYWGDSICGTFFDNMFPDDPINQQYIQDAHICCTEYFAEPGHTAEYNAAICTIPSYAYPSWSTLTAGGPESGLLGYCDYAAPLFDIGEPNACWPTQTCDDCPTDEPPQEGDSDPNIVVAPTTKTVAKSGGYRIVEITRSVTCSGYVEQEVCIAFAEWTIILQDGL